MYAICDVTVIYQMTNRKSYITFIGSIKLMILGSSEDWRFRQYTLVHKLNANLSEETGRPKFILKLTAYDACFPAGLLTDLDSCHRINCDAGIISTMTDSDPANNFQ